MGRHARKTEKKTRRVEGTKAQDRKVRRKARLLREKTAKEANEAWIKNKDKRVEEQKAKEEAEIKAKQDKKDAAAFEKVTRALAKEKAEAEAKAKAEEEAELAAQIARLDEQKKADSAPVVPVAVSGGGGILGALKGAMTAVKDAIVGGAESKP